MEQGTVEKLDTWAVVEMFGHKKLAGKVSEHQVGSAALIRVDVPETLVQRRDGVHGEKVKQPGYTKLVGPGSIYCITPCSEEVARAAAQQLAEWNPVLPVSLPQQLTAGSTDVVDAELEEGDLGEGTDDELESELSDGIR